LREGAPELEGQAARAIERSVLAPLPPAATDLPAAGAPLAAGFLPVPPAPAPSAPDAPHAPPALALPSLNDADEADLGTRDSRKRTYWMFILRSSDAAATGLSLAPGHGICKCGCLAKDGLTRLVYAAPNTGAVARHVEKNHHDLFKEFAKCKANLSNWNGLEQAVEEVNEGTIESLKRQRKSNEKYFTRASDGLDRPIRGNLLLLMWAAANALPRHVLNCPLFDAWLNQLGAQPPPNRHTLQEEYLPLLDQLVVADITARLEKATCVSLSADGWRDRVRRDWIDIGVSWIEEALPGKWQISVVHPDLIPVSVSSTSDTISVLIVDRVDQFVRSDSSPLHPASAAPSSMPEGHNDNGRSRKRARSRNTPGQRRESSLLRRSSYPSSDQRPAFTQEEKSAAGVSGTPPRHSEGAQTGGFHQQPSLHISRLLGSLPAEEGLRRGHAPVRRLGHRRRDSVGF